MVSLEVCSPILEGVRRTYKVDKHSLRLSNIFTGTAGDEYLVGFAPGATGGRIPVYLGKRGRKVYGGSCSGLDQFDVFTCTTANHALNRQFHEHRDDFLSQLEEPMVRQNFGRYQKYNNRHGSETKLTKSSIMIRTLVLACSTLS